MSSNKRVDYTPGERCKIIVVQENGLSYAEFSRHVGGSGNTSGPSHPSHGPVKFASKRDIHPICCKIRKTSNILLFVKKSNSFESLCDLIISDKLFETLKKETATHIGIREAEDWFRPIDLAKECDIYISSKNGSRKEILLLMDIPKTPLKIDHKTLNQRLKRTIPNILKEKIKIALYAVIHLIAQE
ncbi:hypothetical protein TNCV_2387041 [Trichonephila clavipes]|nr:hypothetical protein TNCV_2387041 [Trichonephila clavipes]